MKNIWKSFFLSIAFLGAILGTHAKAQSILLLINDADPSAVTITATTTAATGSSANERFDVGLDLTNFYTSSIFLNTTGTNSSLTTSIDQTPFYNQTQTGSLSGGSFVDLQLYATGQTAIENFVAGTQAFVGTLTLDLSTVSPGTSAAAPNTSLPADGTTGNVYAGTGQLFTPSATLIGTYKVVNAATPEPSTWALLLVGAGLLGTFRYFAKSRGATGLVLG
jgi:hypothetical protein